jgi:ABC-type nitrate/sulfonate/bicarbonate transport system substrate-binding protein
MALRTALLGAIAAAALASVPANAQMTKATINIFPTDNALSIWIAKDKGLFEKEGLDIAVFNTPSSGVQMQGLADGRFQFAETALDNIIAYQEGQGTAPLSRAPDFFVLMGISQIELPLVTVPEVRTYADLKGKTLAVDSLSTGFAFVLRKMLEKNGLGLDDYKFEAVGGTPARWAALKEKKHAGTLSALAYLPEARALGFNHLGNSLDVLGRYQGIVTASSRAWAAQNEKAMVGFIRARLAAIDWIYDPANRDEAVKVLLNHMPNIPAAAAPKLIGDLTSPKLGYFRKGQIDPVGTKVVLDLRSQYGVPKKTLTDPSKYIDTKYLDQALKGRM